MPNDFEIIPATEEDVGPGKELLMIDPANPMKFYKTIFHPSTDWDTILDLIKFKRLYTYGNKRTISEAEGPLLRTTDKRLF